MARHQAGARLAVATAALLLLCCLPPSLHAVAATTKPLTAADVRRIALAAGSGSSARSAGTTGVQQALAVDAPINAAYLAEHPEVGQQVPFTAPASDDNTLKYRSQVTHEKPPRPSSSSRAQAIPLAPIAANAPFVTASGTNFMLDGQVLYPSGTNWYNAIIVTDYTTAEITQIVEAQWQNGVRLFRTWGFSAGFWKPVPIQPAPYVYSEVALQRFDFVMDLLARMGIRVILTMVNYWDDIGGIQWYVNNTIAEGQPKELFYSDARPRALYRDWLRTITNRVNTVNGRVYKNDPTIFSWELCNECHTSDNYEHIQNLYPGQLLYNWQVEMSSFLKNELKVRSMVSNGNEGYRAQGTYDPYASVSYPYLQWANTGLKGEDFNRNLYIQTLDFATIHVYPSSFGVPNTTVGWVNDFFVGDRQALARSAGKPLLLEEFGAHRDYLVPRDTVFQSILSAANAYGLPGSLVWEFRTQVSEAESVYTSFSSTQAGGPTMLTQLAYSLQRAQGAASPFPYDCAAACQDNPPGWPDPSVYSCAAQKEFGKCCESFILVGNPSNTRGYCLATCNHCGCNGSPFDACPTAAAQQSALALPPPSPPPPLTSSPTPGLIEAPTKTPTMKPTKGKPTKRRPTKKRPTKRRPTKRRPTKRRPTKKRPTKKKPTKRV